MNESHLKHIIEELEYRAREEIELLGDLGRLRTWRNDGMLGICPVDLESLGYGEIVQVENVEPETEPPVVDADMPQMCTPDPLKVFISYASHDLAKVRLIYGRLLHDGFEAWLDIHALLPGMTWQAEIMKNLAEADAVILCLSSQSVSKEGFVQKELNFTIEKAMEKPEGTIYLIPIRLDECPVPERLKKFQWVNFDEDDWYGKLQRALEQRMQQLGLISLTHQLNSTFSTRRELDRLMGQALDEESERRYSEAMATLEKLLALEPGNVEARSLRERVIQKKEKAFTNRLKVMLEHEFDFGLLNGAVTEAYKLLDRGDAELNRLYELGKARRDKRREEMGQLTTADAMKELVNVQQLITDVEAAIVRGERTFFDARDNQTRKIEVVWEEARAAIPGLVAAFVDKSLERAATFMPSDPRAAQKVLEEALKNKEIAGVLALLKNKEIVGVSALLKQMEKQEGIYQSEAAKW